MGMQWRWALIIYVLIFVPSTSTQSLKQTIKLVTQRPRAVTLNVLVVLLIVLESHRTVLEVHDDLNSMIDPTHIEQTLACSCPSGCSAKPRYQQLVLDTI